MSTNCPKKVIEPKTGVRKEVPVFGVRDKSRIPIDMLKNELAFHATLRSGEDPADPSVPTLLKMNDVELDAVDAAIREAIEILESARASGAPPVIEMISS